MLGLVGITEHVCLVLGVLQIMCIAPVLGPVIFAAMVWEALDRGFDGGFVDTGKELSGVLLGQVAPWVNRVTTKFNSRFVKRSDDSYMMNSIALFGGVIPLLFGLCFFHMSANGFTLWVWFVYHLLRIGPYFMNFAYVYTLCHKEGHSRTGLFSADYNTNPFLRNVFNWWIGLFYGVMPASFAFGHTINHHRYNNGPLDVVSTSDKERDSLVNFLAYLPRWTSYSLNISTTIQFMNEGNYHVAKKMVYGSAYYWAWFASWAVLDAKFAIAYVLFPFLENVLLLAAVNWSWHAFISPDDPEDEYVGALTILDGQINVLNEDDHVVHHQYPGAHWSDHPKMLDKHWEAYAEHQATIFRKTHAFEVFGLVVARQYDKLAEKFVDLKGERSGKPLSHEEKVLLIQERLRACWWGPRKREDVKLMGKEVGNIDDGREIDGTYGKTANAAAFASLAKKAEETRQDAKLAR